jgi:hypothetical protein
MKKRALLFLSCLASCALESHVASAQSAPSVRVDKATCLDAVSRGQRFRDSHKLVQARDKFRVCARAECPTVVQTDCASWLAEVETTLPTVVLSAKDRGGRDLVDVKVSMDGQPLVGTLDGQAVAVDPGMHTFRFERADGRFATTQLLIKEGGKAQAVSVAIGSPESGMPALPQQGSSGETDTGNATTVPVAGSSSGSSVRLLAILTTGIGLIGVGVGIGVALDAKARDNRAFGELGMARATDSASAVTEGNMATVAVGIGGAMALAGGVLWFVAPSNRAASGSLSPGAPSLALGTNGRGAFLCGKF